MTLNYIVNLNVGNDVYEEVHVHVECNSFEEGIEKIKKSYKEDYVNEFTTDLSFIINRRWDVDSTNMAGKYDRDTIMHSLETELCEKFIDGHTYKFCGYLSYTDADHADDFCMDIDDITEDEVKKLDPPKQKDKAEDIISTFIVNQLGINLVAVKDIQVDRQSDGQIKQIKIDFIPDNKV